MKNRQDANTFDFRLTDYRLFWVSPLALGLCEFCEIAAFHISFEYFTRMFFVPLVFLAVAGGGGGCGLWVWVVGKAI